MMTPLVSVVMPSFNQGEFIADSINSVLTQSYPCIELIIVDGGSTDQTLAILRDKQAQDKRITWISEHDTGPANAINKALAKTRGTLIGWLNSDDLYAKNAVQRAVDRFHTPTKPVFVYGQGEHIDALGQVLGRYPSLAIHEVQSLQTFAQGCFICQPTVFFKRTVYTLLGDLDESLQTAFDLEYWLRVFSCFPERIDFINENQAQSRLHQDCITQKMRYTVTMEAMQLCHKYLHKVPVHWLLDYIHGLLTSQLDHDELISTVKTAIMNSKEYLEAKELSYLANYLALNPVLSEINLDL